MLKRKQKIIFFGISQKTVKPPQKTLNRLKTAFLPGLGFPCKESLRQIRGYMDKLGADAGKGWDEKIFMKEEVAGGSGLLFL